MKLVFVHGRAQEHKDPAALKQEWLAALRAGLAKSGLELDVSTDDVSLPYYGDKLFDLTERLDQIEQDAVARGQAGSDPMLQFEAEALIELGTKAALPEMRERVGDGAQERGPANWGWVQSILRALDRWNGGFSASTISLILRDVYVYTTRGGIAAEIDGIVADAITADPTVIVAHSLGTVVAYNVLRRDRSGVQVPLLVTVGSPLGIRAVRRQLVPLRAPRVGAWFNAFDPRDVVALNPLDAANFPIEPAIENKADVDNSTDNRHGISGYLGDPIVARRIYEALKSGQS